MLKKVKIYNVFRDLNHNDRLILACKIVDGVIEIGDTLLTKSGQMIKIIDVELNPSYNEANLIINSNTLDKKNIKLSELINKEIKICSDDFNTPS
ncbi:hypothetical protein JJC03_03725 [Flavobacterium oreochromis]|uniref:hypothetical protein n=1 Tax=Flavobacterium oreochromis TaxID=2906078 RepID=UPI001CE688D1|nr:hypothetical protein [Flavobacterium oreochromis]QYS87089.1 hypothetical protein JJC03_03725 [Flavobacterium oreochromis]